MASSSKFNVQVDNKGGNVFMADSSTIHISSPTTGGGGVIQTDRPTCNIDYKINEGCGFLLIIHNENFDGSMKKRDGSQKDVDALQEYFGGKLNYQIRMIENKSADYIKEEVDHLAKTIDFHNFDAFLCAILSHGEGAGFYGIDNEIIAIDEIVSIFKGDKWSGKPKLFFVQACRGYKSDVGVVVSDGPTGKQCQDPTSPSCLPPSSLPPPSLQIPSEADILIAYSSYYGYTSHRNTAEGSWFMAELIKQLETHANDKHLTDILTHVHHEVAKMTTPDNKKQMPCYQSSLTKHIYFGF